MKFRIAKDKWTSKEQTFCKDCLLSYDKVQHFIGGFILGVFNVWASITICFLWEIKDGFVKWESGYITTFPIKYNWGGDGFSWKDLTASIIGAVSGMMIIKGIVWIF